MKLKDLKISKCNVRDPKVDDPGIETLSQSIKENSLISKMILRPVGDKFEIVAGQRRYKALIGLYGEDHELDQSEYIVKENLSDDEAFLLSIEENVQRLDLSPLELNRALLRLNEKGYKDKEIARILNVTPYRLKRLAQLSEDLNRIPEVAKQELKKPVEEAKFNDAHWNKLRDEVDKDVVKDVVDMIVEKEASPKDVPLIVDHVKKEYEKQGKSVEEPKETSKKVDRDLPEVLEYVHKGELILKEVRGKQRVVVVTKEGDETVPVDEYLEYLKHPEKFKVTVSFKMKAKTLDK